MSKIVNHYMFSGVIGGLLLSATLMASNQGIGVGNGTEGLKPLTFPTENVTFKTNEPLELWVVTLNPTRRIEEPRKRGLLGSKRRYREIQLEYSDSFHYDSHFSDCLKGEESFCEIKKETIPALTDIRMITRTAGERIRQAQEVGFRQRVYFNKASAEISQPLSALSSALSGKNAGVAVRVEYARLSWPNRLTIGPSFFRIWACTYKYLVVDEFCFEVLPTPELQMTVNTLANIHQRLSLLTQELNERISPIDAVTRDNRWQQFDNLVTQCETVTKGLSPALRFLYFGQPTFLAEVPTMVFSLQCNQHKARVLSLEEQFNRVNQSPFIPYINQQTAIITSLLDQLHWPANGSNLPTSPAGCEAVLRVATAFRSLKREYFDHIVTAPDAFFGSPLHRAVKESQATLKEYKLEPHHTPGEVIGTLLPQWEQACGQNLKAEISRFLEN